jgi:rRNA maturation protein Nop10
MTDKLICPRCGKRAMLRNALSDGRYTLKCEFCGTKSGPFKKDIKKGVI